MTSSWFENSIDHLANYVCTRVHLQTDECNRNILQHKKMSRFIFSNIMMTSSNRNIFRVTGPLCGKFTGHRWIPLTKASDTELWCFLDLHLNKRLSKHSSGWWFETQSCPLWRHCNDMATHKLQLIICTHEQVQRDAVDTTYNMLIFIIVNMERWKAICLQ